MDIVKVGNFIAQRRKEFGYTQEELGNRLHVTDKAVSKWERGLSFPDVSLMNRLATELKISITELLEGETRAVSNSDSISIHLSDGNQPSAGHFPGGVFEISLQKGNWGVSPYLFGNNLEHTRSAVYGGISAQLLRNRKFVGRPNAMTGTALEWFPIGARPHCYFGKSYTHHAKIYHMRRRMECNSQCVVNFYAGETVGFGQNGIPVFAGKQYEFAAVLWSTETIDIKVSLTEHGGGAVLAEAVIYAKRENDWKRYPVLLAPARDEPDADLRITFRGAGAVTFGAVSLLPTDHFHGMRRDVIQKLKETGVQVLRWPGGNFAEEYNWFDGLLPVDERAPFESRQPLATQTHSMGYDFHEINTDDFIALCREIGAEPFLTVNLTWNTAEENAAWVEYCNGDETTVYGRIRIERGYPEPYRVKLWSLGNEFGYGQKEMDNTPSGYAALARESGKKMLAVCPDLSFCTSGPYPNPLWAKDSAKALSDIAPLTAMHYYTNGYPTYLDPERFGEEFETLLACEKAARDKLHELRAELGPEQKISFDEWNVWHVWHRAPGVAEGIFSALMLHMIIEEAQKSGIEIACHFQAVNEGTILVRPDGAVLTAAGQVFAVMKEHINGFLLHASARAVVTGHSNGVVATFLNPSFGEEAIFRLPCDEEKTMTATLYRAENIYPHSMFHEERLPVLRQNGFAEVRIPPHSFALLNVN